MGLYISSVQSFRHVWLFATPWTVAHQASLSITNSQWWKVEWIHVHWVSDTIQPSYPLLSHAPPTFNLSQNQGLFKWVRSSYKVAKVLEFQLQNHSFNEYLGLISFRMDWMDLLAVQGTLKNLLQHHSSKASVFWHLAFFIAQLSHPYMTTGENIALTRQTFVGK